MAADGTERRLAAILNADVVGYSRLMAEDEVDTVARITTYRDQIGTRILEHRGRVVDSPGDELLAEFPSALEATRCAIDIQRMLADHNADLPTDRRMEFRVGVHLGDVLVEGERIYGDGVNIAARLQALADPGGVCISRAVHEQVETKLGLGWDDLGERQVKNIPKPVRAYRAQLGALRPARRRLASGAPRAATAAGVLLLGVLALLAWQRFAPGPARTGPIRSLAVLPLDNLSGDPEQEYFVDGMTEALISDLAKVGSLRVISRTSVMRYRGTRKSLPEIADELHVDAIVEGSVLRSGGAVRITTQLIDGRSDEHLWSESYTRQLDDVLALQSEVARSVAEAIELELTPEQEQQLASPGRVRPDAYDAYVRGSHFLLSLTPSDHAIALGYLEKAVELDPSFAPAWADLSLVYT